MTKTPKERFYEGIMRDRAEIRDRAELDTNFDPNEDILEFDPNTDNVSPDVFKDNTKKLSLEQEQGIELCCDMTETIVGVSGAAGTGKTTILGQTYSELRRRRISVALCAPTGRAAKRVQELTGIEALTVHRLLGYPMPGEDLDGNQVPGEPRHNRQNPLPFRVVICDEASMLSPTLYGELLDALPHNGVIRFFGDNNQLPPVEKGTPPFIDVLDRFPKVILSFNYRSEDAIVSNAGRILRGMFPVRNSRFEIIYSNTPVTTLLEFVKGHREFGTDAYQIIVPTRRGVYGTDRINPSLQLKFNPRGPVLRLDRYADERTLKEPPPLAVRKGDKYLWIKNDYKLNMFNGEIGRILDLDAEQGTLVLSAGDKKVLVEPRIKTYSNWHGHVIDYDPRKQIELGYAVTTHKAQGSEFDTVVYCICRGQFFLLNRRNLYTAVTRAKKNVIIITDRSAMGISVHKKYETK